MAETKKFQVKYSGDGTPSTKVKTSYDKLIQELANDFEVDINVIVCHGKRDFIPAELDFDKFYIFGQMIPDNFAAGTTKVNEVVLGEKKVKISGGQTDTYLLKEPFPKDAKIVRDAKGTPMAIVHDASLYFLNDFIHCHNQAELSTSLEVFKYVMNEATKTPELLKALKSGAEEKGKRALKSTLEKQFKDRLKKENIQMESAAKLIDNYVRDITKAQRKIISTQKIIEAIRSNLDDIPTSLEKKWEQTKKLEGGSLYESISFQRNSVKGLTKPIFVKEKGSWYQMGCFEVTLAFDGNVSIFSTTTDRGVSQQHPHVNGDGKPCWGNLSGELPKRIAESEFDVAFVEIHTFLGHYSQEGGPYANISNWKKATKDQVDQLKAEKVQK